MVLPFVLRLSLWLIWTKFSVLAQKRGPIKLYIVNDTDEPISLVWLNNLSIQGGDLIPFSTGPLLPGAIETYRVNPNDPIELHQAQEDCGTKMYGEAYNPQGECLTALTQVRHQGGGENPTSKLFGWLISWNAKK